MLRLIWCYITLVKFKIMTEGITPYWPQQISARILALQVLKYTSITEALSCTFTLCVLIFHLKIVSLSNALILGVLFRSLDMFHCVNVVTELSLHVTFNVQCIAFVQQIPLYVQWGHIIYYTYTIVPTKILKFKTLIN